MNNEINWEEIHKSFDQRIKGNTTARQLVGEDVHFWADFYKKNKDRLKKLNSCMLLDKRLHTNMGEEQDKWFRMGLDSIMLAMVACENDIKREEIEAKKKKDEAIKKANFESSGFKP